MTRLLILFTFVFFLLIGRPGSSGQTIPDNNYLLRICDTATGNCGYINLEGETIIPPGKYSICFTDTFRIYAIVTSPEKQFVAIDRREEILYEVYPFDNGPDYPSEGLFRIMIGNKIGFADEITGKVLITPQFDCAWPFENGVAEVSTDCRTQSDGEHTTWLSDNWFYIDKSGERVEETFTIPVYLEINDPIYITIKDRVAADIRQRSDTTSEESKFFAAKINLLSEEQQKEFESVFITSITDYTSRAHFNTGAFILNFNELGRMDSITIAKEFDIRIQFLGNDTYSAEFWEKVRQENPPWVMVLLYVRQKDGSITFQDPFQPAIDFLMK